MSFNVYLTILNLLTGPNVSRQAAPRMGNVPMVRLQISFELI